jgi:nitrogen fixation/metabolism regulation signal transduction histidine kinase
MKLRYKNKRVYLVLSTCLFLLLAAFFYYNLNLYNISLEAEKHKAKKSLTKVYEISAYIKSYSYEANKAINNPNNYSIEDFENSLVFQQIDALLESLEDKTLKTNFKSYNLALGAMLEAFKNDNYTDKSIKQFFNIMENTLENIDERISFLKKFDNTPRKTLEHIKNLRNLSFALFLFVVLVFISLIFYIKRISVFTDLVEDTIEEIADGNTGKNPYIYTKDFEGIAYKLNRFKNEVFKRDEEVRNIITTLEKDKAKSDAWYQYFLTVLNNFNKPVIVLDNFIKIGFINKEAKSFLKIKQDLKLINKPLSDISSLKDVKDLNTKIGDSIFNLKSFFIKSELKIEDKNYNIKISIMPLIKKRDALGAICIIDIL